MTLKVLMSHCKYYCSYCGSTEVPWFSSSTLGVGSTHWGLSGTPRLTPGPFGWSSRGRTAGGLYVITEYRVAVEEPPISYHIRDVW